jgi:Fe-S-cluster containining protein
MDAPSAVPPRTHYDCLKCPAYCCSYDRIIVNAWDLKRLAKHFGVTVDVARLRFTKIVENEQVLRHQKDEIYGSVCMFLNKETRRCTVYEARPGVCHEYPDRPRCGYYDFLRWERRQQDDKEFVPLKRG